MATPTPLSPTDAKSLIEQIVAQGTVLLTGHCKRDSMPSRGVTLSRATSRCASSQCFKERV